MLKPFELYLLSSSTYRKKQFNEVRTRQVQKVEVAILDKTLGNVHHFCNDPMMSKISRNWCTILCQVNMRFVLHSFEVQQLPLFPDFFLNFYFLKRKIYTRIQCWYPMWGCHKSLRIASLMGGNPLGEKYIFEYYFTYIQYIYI